MIKFICDMCGEEYRPQNTYCEIKTRDNQPIILPPQKGKQQMMDRVVEHIYHLCPKCRNKLIGQFKSEK